MSEDTDTGQDELWARFHELVNMSSRELREWLGIVPDLDPKPGGEGPPPLGEAVAGLLGKRHTDITQKDREVMQKVIDIVQEEMSGVSHAELVNDVRRRERFMNVGHDVVQD